MRIRIADSTGCPVPQFVVYAETQEEKVILSHFCRMSYDQEWMFFYHGASYKSDDDGVPYAFNFGWKRRPTDIDRIRWKYQAVKRRIRKLFKR